MATLMRRQPLADFAGLHDQLDRMFERVVAGGRGYSPAIDIVREEDAIVVKADVPGIAPDEVKIKAENGILTPKAG